MEAGNVPSLKHPWDLPSRPVPTGEPSLPFPKAAVLLHSGGVPEVACPHTSTFLIPAAKSRWCPPTRFSVPLCSKHLERAVSDSAPAAPQERFPIWLPCPHPGVLTKVAYGPLARSDGQSPVLRGNLTRHVTPSSSEPFPPPASKGPASLFPQLIAAASLPCPSLIEGFSFSLLSPLLSGSHPGSLASNVPYTPVTPKCACPAWVPP